MKEIALSQETIDKNMTSPVMSPGKRRRQEISEYWIGKTLGQGTSGCVKMGIHKLTGEKVAIKIIPKSYLVNTSAERSVKREIAIMKLMNHPYIISLLDVIELPDSPNLYLILEYVQGGELFEHLLTHGKLCEDEARKYFQQIITGLDYCHRHLVCHRDLKPENLLLDNDKNIKIADFGMASLQPTGSLLETSCGSPHYASPEVVNGFAYDGSASDIWSCGVILYALLSGRLPFDFDDIRQLLRKVKRGKYRIPPHVSSEAKDLIQKILVINPKNRLTMDQVKSHPWFTMSPTPFVDVLPDPPPVSEIGRPVNDESEVEESILETLKALWTELSTKEILKELLNREYNMLKVTYVLLQRHANAYWESRRNSEILSVITLPKRRRRPVTICVSPRSKEPLPGLEDMINRFYEQENIKPSHEIQYRCSLSQSSSNVSLVPVIPQEEREVEEKKGFSTTDALTPVPCSTHSYNDQTTDSDRYQDPLQIVAKPKRHEDSSWLSPLLNRLCNKAPQYLPNIHINHESSKTRSVYQQFYNLASPARQFISSPKESDFYLKSDKNTKLSIQGSLLSRRLRRKNKVDTLDSSPNLPEKHSKRSSWIPEIFNMKKPQMCTLECKAKDQDDVVKKLSLILHKYMNGLINTTQQSDGRVHREGEMRLIHNTKSVFLKFQLEIYPLLIKKDIYRINFIQHQGDVASLSAAVRIIDKTLKIIESN